MSNENLAHFGLTFPKELVRRIDVAKGKYLSRNKYILKIIEEHLNENEKVEMLQGYVVGRQSSRAAVPTTQNSRRGGSSTDV